MTDRNRVHEGMVVRSSDGKKLGRVLACEEASFVVEKGFFFTTDYIARYDDVKGIARDEIQLARAQRELARAEHASQREGAFGESFTLGLGHGPDAPRRQPWAQAEEEEEMSRRVRGGGDAGRPGYDLGAHPDGSPQTFGDEGGRGLL